MTATVRVGLVGLGTIAEVHLAVLAETPAVDLVFTADPQQPAPSFRGTRPPHYGSLDAALASVTPDLVVIAAPTATHAELVATAVTRSPARVLAEKPLAADVRSLARLRALASESDLAERVFVAHHFAFSPEVVWAGDAIAAHPAWGPVTGITSAFYDPYVLEGERAFASYGSSWADSGSNQLSMLSRFVDLEALSSAQHDDGGASAWCAASFRSHGEVGSARLRTSWLTGASSKRTTLTFGRSGVEVWLDHTAMTGFAAQGDAMLAAYGNDGRTPRKLAHYRPLYASLLSDAPDDVLTFGTAAGLTELLHSVPDPARARP